MDIKQVCNRVHYNARAKGFFEEGDKKNIGEMLMLIVTEVAEAMEADRRDKFCEKREDGSPVGSYKRDAELYLGESNDWFEHEIKNTFQDELADIVIRVFDMAAFKGIDLEWHIMRKIIYNESRPFKHGGKKC